MRIEDKNWRLRDVAQQGVIDATKRYLKNGADVHTENDRALRWASHNGHTEVVKILLEAGADVHALEDCAIRWAGENYHVDVIKLLLEAGANFKKLKMRFSSREEAIRYFELMAI